MERRHDKPSIVAANPEQPQPQRAKIETSITLPPASDEQMACVDALIAGNNVTVQAAAGAGKSTTFYHTAKAWLDRAAAPGTKVLQLCFNVVLRVEAENRVRALGLHEKIDCFTIHALAGRMFETRVSDTMSLHRVLDSTKPVVPPGNYSLCLIDEAQDLSTDHIAVINRLQTVLNMRFMVVGDMRQEIYTFATLTVSDPVLACPQKHLHDNGLPWKTLQLTTSYRLTPRNCAFVNTLFRHVSQSPIAPGNTKFRDCVPIYVVGDRYGDNDVLNVIREMLQRYRPSEIMILAPSVSTTKYRCKDLAKDLSRDIAIFSTHKQRAEITSDMLKDKLFLSTFHQSKGYERPCVIVLGAENSEWVQNSEPTIAGEPIVHNSLHVACTRAQEQLVLFQDYKSAPYPTLTLQAVEAVAELRMLRDPKPNHSVPHNFGPICQDAKWLTNFQPREVLLQMLKLLDFGPEHVCGPIMRCEPNRVAVMSTQLAEDVWDYYPQAVLSAAQARLTGERTLMQTELFSIAAKKIPPSFVTQFDTLKQLKTSMVTPKDWLAMSAMHNTLIEHECPHELLQMQDLSWFTATDEQFFQEAEQNVTTALRDIERGYWNEDSVPKTVERYKFKLKTAVRFAEWSSNGLCTPWQFSFETDCTEADLLMAMVHLWAFSASTVKIFSIVSNRVFTVKAPLPDDLERLIWNMMAVRRNM